MPDLTPGPWVTEGRWPTATELERHIAVIRPSERVVYLEALLRQAQVGATCDAMDHHGQLAALFHNGATLIAAAARYRDAWASARRRAQHLREVLGLVDDVPIDLVLDETTETVTWEDTTP